MIARLVFTALADADSAEIFVDLAATASAKTALRYDSAFERLYDRLSTFPESGALRPALGEHLRICVVSPFVIIYRYLPGDDTLTVLRIVHGRRRISGLLLTRRD